MFFISPPFGNYIHLPETKSIHGSFTLNPRPGLFMQIIRTLRYSFENEGWVNKIGLRNKGIDWAIKNVDKSNIISIAILNQDEIESFLQKIPNDRNIELNVSCPNAEKKMINTGLSKFIHPNREWCILKISPNTTNQEINEYYKQGFRQFHCCNTLPIEGGGLSGKSLKPYTNEKIEYIKTNLPDSTVIAGGGITNLCDFHDYKKKGASHFSASTVFFNPYLSYKLYNQYLIHTKK